MRIGLVCRPAIPKPRSLIAFTSIVFRSSLFSSRASKQCVKEYIKSTIESPKFSPILINSLSSKFRESLYIEHMTSMCLLSKRIVLILNSIFKEKLDESFFKKIDQHLSIISSVSLKISYNQCIPPNKLESLVGQVEKELEQLFVAINLELKSILSVRDGDLRLDSMHNELIDLFAQSFPLKTTNSFLFLQNIFRFAFQQDIKNDVNLLLLSMDDEQPTKETKFSHAQVSMAKSFLLLCVRSLKSFYAEPYLKCLVSADINRAAFLRPNSAFVLAIRTLEASGFDFTHLLNLSFFKTAFSELSCNYLSRKKLFLYELLSQATSMESSVFHAGKDSLMLVPSFSYCFAQLVFTFAFGGKSSDTGLPNLSEDIRLFFSEIKGMKKASLLSYLLYVKFLKLAKSVGEIRQLEHEMASAEWIEEMSQIREATDIIPQTDSTIIANAHFFMNYIIDEGIPNYYPFSYYVNALDSIFVPLSIEDARDLIFLSAYSKLKAWGDIHRIFLDAKTEGRLDIPVKGYVRSSIFHFGFISIMFQNVLHEISWNEVTSYLQYPSPLFSKEGCRLLYSHLYNKLFGLFISHDKFLLIQSVASIHRTVLLQDEYILPGAFKALVQSTGRGNLGPPNRTLFYKLLSNRLDIEITCATAGKPPPHLVEILNSLDPLLGGFLHFLELHGFKLHPSTFLCLLLLFFRNNRYDLISQTYNSALVKGESYSQYIYFVSALKNRDFKLLNMILDEKSRRFFIPKESILKEFIVKDEVQCILPSSMSSMDALDKWRSEGKITDSEYSSALSISHTYHLENLYYIRRYVSLSQGGQTQDCRSIQQNLHAKLPDSVVKLVAIPQFLVDYELQYFPSKAKESKRILDSKNTDFDAFFEDSSSSNNDNSLFNYY